MIITHKLRLNLTKCNCQPVVDAVQGESNTRQLLITLFSNSTAWNAPAGTTAAVAFLKPDGTRGLYDKLPNGTAATTVSGHNVTAILAPQVLTCAGTVLASIVFYDKDLDTLATFPFRILVEKNPAADEKLSNNYYTLQNLDQVNTAYAALMDQVADLQRQIDAIPDSSQNVALTADQISALDGMFKVCAFIKADVSAEYNAFKTAFGITDSGGGEVEPDEPDEPVIPDEPETGVSNETTWTDGVAYTGITWEEDKYLHASTGEVKTDEGWGLTQYLYCEGAARIHIENTFSRGGSYSGFFNANKVWISSFCGTVTSADVTVPENAAYFRLATDMTGTVTITPYANA